MVKKLTDVDVKTHSARILTHDIRDEAARLHVEAGTMSPEVAEKLGLSFQMQALITVIAPMIMAAETMWNDRQEFLEPTP